MPTLSASEYTQFLKYKAANASPIRAAIQTRDNVATSQSLINAQVLASQAAFVSTTPSSSIVTSSATVTGALTSVITAAVGDGTLITYTTTQAHGLTTGDVITVLGLATFTAANVTSQSVTVTGSTSFTVAVAATGTATGTGRIVGRVYYTTNNAHGLSVGEVATVTGVTTFSVSNATVLAVPTATTFVLSSTTTGVAVTGQTGAVSVPRSSNQFLSVRGLARVQAIPVVQFRSTPTAKSTVSLSGTLSSSQFQRPGGLPTGFKNSQGTYTRVPQQAGW